MKTTVLNHENPFEFVARIIARSTASEAMQALIDQYSLEDAEAKAVVLSTPAFQEKFCRERIAGSKTRGSNKYGSMVFLRRRFKLTDEEATRLVDDFWDCGLGDTSKAFFEMMSPSRIASTQLTEWAQDVVTKQLLADQC